MRQTFITFPLVLLFSVLLTGCGDDTRTAIRDATIGWITDEGKVDPETKPTELSKDFAAKITIKERWSRQVGKGTADLYLKIVPATDGTSVYVADREGGVLSLAVADGHKQWSARDENRLISAGPGLGDGAVLVGTSQGEVVARDATSGKKLWIAKVSSEVVAVPRAANGVVLVRTGDSNLFALDSRTGVEKWVYDRSVPALTLRGAGAPTLHEGVAYTGFANGRVVALRLETGSPLWDVQLAQPTGRSDLERLVDIDGEPAIKDSFAYIGGFQGKIAALNTDNGNVEWSRVMSTYDNVAVDEQRVYVTDERGVVWALNRTDGSAVWRQKDLKFRHLTAPTRFERYLVVGDFEGYLHWLDAETGEIVARLQIDKKRILTAPINMGDVLLGYSSSGRIAVFSAK